MGQRQNQSDIEYGNDCDLKFDPGETPKYVYARFVDIETCPEAPATAPNDHAFRLTQDPAKTCEWFYDDIAWHVAFFYNAVQVMSRLWLWHKATGSYYFVETVPGYVDEGHVFENEITWCAGAYQGRYGIGVVTWRSESILLMDMLNIKAAYDVFMEMRPRDNGARIYKYCKVADGMNVCIAYNP